MSAFKDRVAIVTGASSGIGQATAKRFAREGAAVYAIARRAERLDELHQEYANIEPVPCDVTDHARLEESVKQIITEEGKIDVLVNNAGFSYYERHQDGSLEHWRQTQAVNVEAMYVLAKLVVPHMIEHRYGRIVNVSSTQSIASESVVGAYAASKGAINAWSRALAVDLAEYGILVNVVAPGCTLTEMNVIDGVDETATDYFQKWYVEQRKIPLARAGTADELANAILFLSGEECTYITGHTLVVGYRAFKVEPMMSTVGHIVELATKAREALGPDAILVVDVGYRFNDVQTCVKICKVLEDLDIYFFETPFPVDTFEPYAKLAAKTTIPLAMGEHAVSRWECLHMIDFGKVAVVQPYMNTVGGITEAKRIVERAKDRGALVIPGNWSTQILGAATVHLAAYSPITPLIEFAPAEVFDSPLRSALQDIGHPVVDGAIQLPTKPGIGIEIPDDLIQQYKLDL